MRINFDLAREILIATANADIHTRVSNHNICPNEDSDIIGWHIGKLIEAGYLKAIDARSKTGMYDYIGVELTYNGEQFLNKIENNQTWDKIKRHLSDNVTSITFQAIELTYKLFCQN